MSLMIFSGLGLATERKNLLLHVLIGDTNNPYRQALYHFLAEIMQRRGVIRAVADIPRRRFLRRAGMAGLAAAADSWLGRVVRAEADLHDDSRGD